ncbi:protein DETOXIFICATION 51-like [Cynara cardunculus var. scolymus]|uniref:Protein DETOXIFICATION n=1 Tax=Cynara cardunculus var. scolymus TaxID=59895 RepID=A0A118K0B8_CYNCS|nr:protein DETOXIFICATION 51-like [Cynara cardunculus var. scolymus]KVI01218.1 Multi antimicrobial extrusion protein [Cynara cardunculus var. scolymus]
MCNPTTNPPPPPPPTAVSDHLLPPPPPPHPHFYLDLFSLSIPKTHSKNPQYHPNNILLIPSPSEIIHETKALFKLSSPIALTALILYTRSIISMLFLGRLGDTELAAGSLAIAFANITGYSVLSGLALGMEPLCSQAFGARRPKLLSITLHRTVIFLLLVSIPIAFLWLNTSRILIYLHQDHDIARLARTYLIFTLPDLVSNSFIHPTRIYLRAQGITLPLTLASLIGTLLQFPMTYLLVFRLNSGVVGVAAASSVSNFVVLVALVFYVWWTGLYLPTWNNPTRKCLTGWGPLVRLAAPSCVSVCLEWWWYEIMIVLCGLLVDPKATVASMGVLIQTTALLYVFPSSLSFAVSTRVGNELGANRPDKARVSAMVSVFFAGLMGLSAMLFATSMRQNWGRMFTNDSNILRLTSMALPIIGLCELGNCPQTVGCGVVRGTARPTTAANVNLGAFYLVGMPIAVGLGFGLRVGFIGLWVGLLSAQVCCAGLMLYVVGTTDWENQAKKAEMLTCNGGAGGDASLASPDRDIEKQPLICIMMTSS